VFPSENSESFAHVSEIAHIRGAQEGSARYDKSMTDDKRRSYENLIVLCPTCHGKVDNIDLEADYTCERLEEWKRTVERSGGLSKSRKDVPTISLNNSPGSIATVNQVGDNIIGAPTPTMSILRQETTHLEDGLFKQEILVGSKEGAALMNATYYILFKEPFSDVESFIQTIGPGVTLGSTSKRDEIGHDGCSYSVTFGLISPGHGLALRFMFPTKPTIVESYGTIPGPG